MIKIYFSSLIVIIISIVSHGQPIMVTNNGNTSLGSLREAIYEANYQPGPDTIMFNIPGAGTHTINVHGDFPEINDVVFIDGFSQPGAKPNTNDKGKATNAIMMIEIHAGQSPDPNLYGLVLNSDACKIQGLVINNFNRGQIVVYGNNTVIRGNYIGIDIDGNSSVGYGAWGVYVAEANSCLIGGPDPEARNVIAGSIYNIKNEYSSSFTVMGNYIGVNASGTEQISTFTEIGVLITFMNNVLIGGDNGNLISGNKIGIHVMLNNSNVNIKGNLIGTTADGIAAIPNNDGIVISNCENLVIGGLVSTDRNVISGNSETGISAQYADENLTMSVLGNYIGYAADGVTPLGNAYRGIKINNHNNTIGTADAPNLIGNNGIAGITLTAGIDNKLYDNIFSGNGIGIDLNNDGPTPNDENDLDNGPNNLINNPVFSLYEIEENGDLVIDYWVDCMAATAVYPLTVKFFKSAKTGSPQGSVLLGSDEYYISDLSNGSATVNLGNALSLGIEPDDLVVALVHDGPGNTSEFSAGYWVNGIHEALSKPMGATLYQNAPNPCTHNTIITYSVSKSQYINLSVYGQNGKYISTLVNQHKTPGNYEVEYSTVNLMPGQYYYRLSNGDKCLTQKMIVME